MGNTSTTIIFIAAFSLMSMIFTLSMYAVDPCSNELFGNYVMSNMLTNNMGISTYTCVGSTNIHMGSISFNNTDANQISHDRASTSGLSGVGASIMSIFPDWMFYGFSWITGAGAFIINIIGAPYTLAMALLPVTMSSFASAIGAFFSVVFLWFFISWITGKDN